MIVSEIHRLAALDNGELCASMWRAHGLGVEFKDGFVACLGTPPRFYPNIVTMDATIDPLDQAQSISERAAHVSGPFFVKDSFQALALESVGFEPLFDASWIYRPAGLAPGVTRLKWRRVTEAAVLRHWESAWSTGADQPPLFVPRFLAGPAVTMLAGWADDKIEAGCVITIAGGVAGISNVFGEAPETIGAAATMFCDFDLVGYESGDALAAALDAGFQVVGDLMVWQRC
ncbi:MAG TPA: hypothetical protein VGV17_19685 [Bosea sp. (in: a-proteobacteria)]|jgi:hypothetical protein|uniref:hypothetical protein n=1 Tax=Bosea sp. (in: a-proteobacteria) TaxID=1871050 RepID=UPI002DDCE67C|nr:hypothetical protein [Bosea sp. (in: a-proteobacteria)]HEV2555982.1 hypothetical protein [Bosea sp. (in: a-proteobacteria)]